jgi:hypothetical protein
MSSDEPLNSSDHTNFQTLTDTAFEYFFEVIVFFPDFPKALTLKYVVPDARFLIVAEVFFAPLTVATFLNPLLAFVDLYT